MSLQPANALLLIIASEIRDSLDPDSQAFLAWKKCCRTLKEHKEPIYTIGDLEKLHWWGKKTAAKTWKLYEDMRRGGDLELLVDGLDPTAYSRKKAKTTTARRGKQPKAATTANRYLPDIPDSEDERDGFSDVFGLLGGFSNQRAGGTVASQAIAGPSAAQHTFQSQSSSATLNETPIPSPEPNGARHLDGFGFWYLDDTDERVASCDNATIKCENQAFFKIEFLRSQHGHPWVRNYVQAGYSNGRPGTYFGWIPTQIGDTIYKCPGFDLPPVPTQNPAPVAPTRPEIPRTAPVISMPTSSQMPGRTSYVPPVPLSQRTSSLGGPSNSLLQADFARSLKTKHRGSIDPSRTLTPAAWNALSGAGIRHTRPPSSMPSSDQAPPSSSPTRTWSSDRDMSTDANNPSSSSPPLPGRTLDPIRYAPIPALSFDALMPNLASASRGTKRRASPRASDHTPAPRSVAALDSELEDYQRTFRSSQASAPMSSQPSGSAAAAVIDYTSSEIYSSSNEDYLRPFTPHVFPAGSYDVCLILDNREMQGRKDHIIPQLRELGVNVETRALNLGDAVWVATKKAIDGLGGPQECVLDWIVERKRMDDIVQSIVLGGRFHEQKFRLEQSGLGRVYYLIEHFHTALEERHRQTVDTAVSSTGVIEHFRVYETDSLKETIKYLAKLHMKLLGALEGKSLRVIPTSHIRRSSYKQLQDHLRKTQGDIPYLTSWDDFQALNTKTGLMTLREEWSRKALCINGLSPEKVRGIVEHYGTFSYLMEAFIEAEETEQREKERVLKEEEAENAIRAASGKGPIRSKLKDVPRAKHLLTRIPNVKGREKIGVALSEKVHISQIQDAFTVLSDPNASFTLSTGLLELSANMAQFQQFNINLDDIPSNLQDLKDLDGIGEFKTLDPDSPAVRSFKLLEKPIEGRPETYSDPPYCYVFFSQVVWPETKYVRNPRFVHELGKTSSGGDRGGLTSVLGPGSGSCGTNDGASEGTSRPFLEAEAEAFHIFGTVANLTESFLMQHDLSAISLAITLLESGMDILPDLAEQVRVAVPAQLALWLHIRFLQTGDKNDLQRSIDLYRVSLRIYAPDDGSRAEIQNQLGEAILSRFRNTNDLADLELGVETLQDALSLQSPTGPFRQPILRSLGHALLIQYTILEHDPSLLDNAIAYFKEAFLDLQELHGLNRYKNLFTLGTALMNRFYQLHNNQDLQDGIQCFSRAMLETHGQTEHSECLNTLGNALQARYTRMGKKLDLDTAIYSHRAAAFTCYGSREDPAQCVESFLSLADALSLRFQDSGTIEDLDTSIKLYHSLLQVLLPAHPDYVKCLAHYGRALGTRFLTLMNTSDLDDSIDALRRARKLNPQTDVRLSSVIDTNLSTSLLSRSIMQRSDSDLDEAITIGREALERLPTSDPNRLVISTNLSVALRQRAEKGGIESDLREWALCCEVAAANVAVDSPARSRVLHAYALTVFNIGLSFVTTDGPVTRDTPAGDVTVADVVEVVWNLLQEAINAPSSPSLDRLGAACRLVKMSWPFPNEGTIPACSHLLDQLDTTMAQIHSFEGRHEQFSSHHASTLQEAKALVGEIASQAIMFGEPEKAVEFLDRGRGVLFAQASQYRMSLDPLAAVRPDLALRLAQLSNALEHSGTAGEKIDLSLTQVFNEDSLARYQRTVEDWNKTVEEIRQIDGFESFLKPASFEGLQAAAAHGPVILVAIGQFRSDALIVSKEGSPLVVPLPDASRESMWSLSRKLAEHVKDKRDRGVAEVLAVLWEVVVQPIAKELEGTLRLPRKARIWWCPTTPVSRLPLHAAGVYSRAGQNLPDLYTSSYTSTLGMLVRARESLGLYRDLEGPHMIAVGQPETPGQVELPAVHEELRCIKKRFPWAHILEGEHGTREAVLSHLRSHHWLHLSCHGHVKPDTPFQSHFSLHDGQLTLLDLMKQHLPFAELAVLSACHSAAGDTQTPDEFLHLAAAVQFAGFKSVVGTMWAMADEDGPRLSDEFYRQMWLRAKPLGQRPNCTWAAEALRSAVKEMRRKKVPLHRWINFVHWGV
ncbi:hypothetical protein FRB99_007846 [Tulasnella sp. 403]|nr:hypothetical protein FRB99_007846 [Tulasnella sp. 403]